MDASDVKVTPDLKHVLKTMCHLLLNGDERYQDKPMYEDLQNMSRKHYVLNRDILRASDSHWVEAHINMFYFRQMCLKTGAIAAAGTPSKYLRMLFKDHKRISKGQYYIQIDWLLALIAGVDDNMAFVALRDRIVQERETHSHKVTVDFEEFPPANALVTNTVINEDGSVAQGKGKITTTNIRPGRKSPNRKNNKASGQSTGRTSGRRGRVSSKTSQEQFQSSPAVSSSSSSSSAYASSMMMATAPQQQNVVVSPVVEYDSDNDTLPDKFERSQQQQQQQQMMDTELLVNEESRKRNREAMENALSDYQVRQLTSASFDDLETGRYNKRFAGVSSSNGGQSSTTGGQTLDMEFGNKPEAVPMWDVMQSMNFSTSGNTIDKVWTPENNITVDDEMLLNDSGLWKSIAAESASMSSNSSPISDMFGDDFDGFDGFTSLQVQDSFEFPNSWIGDQYV